jgi:lambda repressor-like predicted transcriptional regulator
MSRRNADPILLTALASGLSLQQAALKAGISISTARRRVADDAFKAELTRLQDEAIASARAVLLDNSTIAAATVASLLSQKWPPSVRLAAARTILEMGPAVQTARQIEDRLAEVERLLNPPETPPSITSIRREAGKEQ